MGRSALRPSQIPHEYNLCSIVTIERDFLFFIEVKFHGSRNPRIPWIVLLDDRSTEGRRFTVYVPQPAEGADPWSLALRHKLAWDSDSFAQLTVDGRTPLLGLALCNCTNK